MRRGGGNLATVTAAALQSHLRLWIEKGDLHLEEEIKCENYLDEEVECENYMEEEEGKCENYLEQEVKCENGSMKGC